jgi:lysophospholipase L1-like esterase
MMKHLITILLMGYLVTGCEKGYDVISEILGYNVELTDLAGYVDNGEIIPVIVGETIHIFGDAVANTPVVNTLSVEYVCSIGAPSGNDYIITADSGDIGNIYLYIKATNDGVVIRQTRSTLAIKAKVNTGVKTITLLGNSLIDRGGDSELVKIRSIFPGMTWTGIGLTGSAPDLREGYPSRTYEWIVTNPSSPFTKAGALDIPAYYADNGLIVPDFVYMRMGVNTAFSHPPALWTQADSDEWIAWITELVDGFLAHDPNILIVVAIPTSCTTSAAVWEAENPGNPYQDDYITIIHQMGDGIIEAFADYDARVTVGFAQWQLDRTNGYNDDVHPNGDGYDELGEGLANSLNNLL